MALCFLGTAADEAGRRTVDLVSKSSNIFDGAHAAFFGVSVDPSDEAEKRLFDRTGMRFFLDFNGFVSNLYGVVSANESQDGARSFQRAWFIIDPTLRVMAILQLDETEKVLEILRALPPPDQFAGIQLQAPILYLPSVFEPAFCRRLISLYDASAREISGVMREVDGKTVEVHDVKFKVRRDYHLEDPALEKEVESRILRAIVPEIAKVHQFKVTHLERYMVGCYAVEDNAHFNPHRDNTTKGTAHRRFAVSINLNADFVGGEIYFPEYGPRSFKPPPGCAVVFSCSLLHAVTRVTSGKRYAFLPFLYDEAAAKLRALNLDYLAGKSEASGALPSGPIKPPSSPSG